MAKALVVDDSKVDRLLIGSLLEKGSDLEVSFAADGSEALNKLEQEGFELVVTDLMMPGMNGLELVDRIRAKFPMVPVILVTSRGSEDTAVQALRKGAASYVPKRDLAVDLVETAEQVLSSAQRQQCRSELFEAMTCSESVFELRSDRRLFSHLVGYLQENLANLGTFDETDRTRLGVALEEALVNAAEHGNLELDSRLRSEDRDTYLELARERLELPPYCERRVHVEARLSRSKATFLVRDEGRGFDPNSLPDPTDPTNLLEVHGRGVLIMRTFMDEVRFNDVGNEVTLVKRGD